MPTFGHDLHACGQEADPVHHQVMVKVYTQATHVFPLPCFSIKQLDTCVCLVSQSSTDRDAAATAQPRVMSRVYGLASRPERVYGLQVCRIDSVKVKFIITFRGAKLIGSVGGTLIETSTI